MAKQHRVHLTPNGNGAQPYLPRVLLDDSRCPLNQGEESTAIVIEGVGILLSTGGSDDTDTILEDLTDGV